MPRRNGKSGDGLLIQQSLKLGLYQGAEHKRTVTCEAQRSKKSSDPGAMPIEITKDAVSTSNSKCLAFADVVADNSFL